MNKNEINKTAGINSMYGTYLNMAGAMFITGSAMVVSKVMVDSLPVFLAAEFGIGVSLLLLLPVCFIGRKKIIRLDLDFKTWGVFLLQALLGVVLYRVLIFLGLHYTTAAVSGLIAGITPAAIALMACVLLKETLKKSQIFGILLASTGLFAVNLPPFFHGSEGTASLKGCLLIFLAVICEAVFSVLSKAKCIPVSPLYRTTVIAFFAFLLLSPFAIYDGLHYDWAGFKNTELICILYYGVFVSFLSYVLWFKGVEKADAASAGVFTSIASLSSIFLSSVILKETITIAHIAGFVLISGGVGISCGFTDKEKEFLTSG